MPATDSRKRTGNKILTQACIQLRLTSLKIEFKANNWFVVHVPTKRKWAAIDDKTKPHGFFLEETT